MACAYAGAEYESVEYEAFPKKEGGWDVSSWFGVKPGLVEKNGIMNLPYIIDGDVVITQSNACLMYIGRKFGLLGSTEADLAAVEQVLCEVMDIRGDTTKMAYGTGDVANHDKTKSFEKIEKFVTQRGTKYSAADTVTVADMHLFEMVDQNYLIAQKAGKKDFLASCPKVLGIWKAIKEDPRLEAYFAGPEYQLPQNNKMAKYGYDLNDGR